MRTLGIDFGEARIGLAVSDGTGTIAMPRGVIAEKNKGDQIRLVVAAIEEAEAVRVVVGMPFELDGSAGPMCELVEKFCTKLESVIGATVVRWDERLTSVAAQRAILEMGGHRSKKRGKKKKGEVDTIAACLLLQGYLDSAESRVDP